MKTIFFLCILLLSSSSLIHAQNKLVDNQLNQLKKLSLSTLFSNNVESEMAVNKLFLLAKKHKKKKYIAFYYNTKGIIVNNRGQFDSSIVLFKKSIDLSSELKDSNELIQAKNNLAGVYDIQSNFVEAIKIYLEILSYPYTINDSKLYAQTLHNTALTYTDKGNLNKALVFENKALKIYKNIKDKSGEISVLLGLSSIYVNLGDFKKAIEYNETSLRLARLTKNKRFELTNLIDLGANYFDLGNYKKAIYYFKSAEKCAHENKDEYSVALNLNNLGSCYALMQVNKKSISYFEQSLAIAYKVKINDLIETNCSNLAEMYEIEKNYKKAIAYTKEYIKIHEEIINQQTQKDFIEINKKYESEKKQKKILELKNKIKEKQKDKEILENKIQKRNAVIAGTLIGAILLITSLILFFHRRKLILANAHQKEINEQRELTTTEIVQALEKEQSRIAKDLHDSIGTFLSTLKINLQLYEDAVPTAQQKSYQNTLNLIDKISFELRNIMKNLSHDTLQDHGLGKAIEEFTGRLNDLKITEIKQYISDLSPKATEHIQHNLYRISQELLSNCIKHAKAKYASIQIIEDENGISLVYEDDGIGILPSLIDNRNASQSMGLKNIFNRVEFIRGVIQIDSNPKSGTTIIIEIPTK